MFVFPIIYIISFVAALVYLYKNKTEGVLLFFIFGLPIYTTTLSVTFMYGLTKWVPVLQSFKEVLVITTLITLLFGMKERIRLHLVDKLMLAFFVYSLLYVFIPLGQFGLINKLMAFKGLSFFVPVYFVGRLFDIRKIYISKNFHYICAVTVAASLLLVFEVVTYQHIQIFTGYADYNYYFFNQSPSGNYGLSWTFEVNEIGSGAKRFASFFSNPLEFAAATVLTTSILAALYTNEKNKIKADTFGVLVIASTLFAIFFALSRASMLSYFLLIYTYAYITDKKKILLLIHVFFIIAILFLIFFVSKDVQGFVINTLNFSNLSSLGHILEWMDGIQAMISRPLGIGLGESGRVAGATGDNVGGESQIIILGVQVGVLALAIYIAVYVILIRQSYRWFTMLKGKERKLSLAVFLLKIGFIIPMITANFESYIYLSYIGWFLSGLFINVVARNSKQAISPAVELSLNNG